MARPTRTFTGQEGQRATGSAGPDPIRRDLDSIFAMFNPEATLPSGEAGGIDPSENVKTVQLDPDAAPEADAGKIPTILSGIVNRIKAIAGGPDWKTTPPTTVTGLHSTVTNITVDQNEAPQDDTGNLHQMLSWIVNRLKTITGKDDWKTDPAATLQDISEAASHEDISYHAIAKSGVHGVGDAFVAKTSRPDQWPAWEDLKGTPPVFPLPAHQHSAQDVIDGQFPPERIANLPASKVTTGQFHIDRIPNLPTSKVTSGTFSEARLPSASTSQRGIVQLTNSRSNSSETIALTAAAMNAHRTSADHDGRYVTRSEFNDRLSSAILLAEPSDDVVAESLARREFVLRDDSSLRDEFWVGKSFRIWASGRYRLTFEAGIVGTSGLPISVTVRTREDVPLGYGPNLPQSSIINYSIDFTANDAVAGDLVDLVFTIHGPGTGSSARVAVQNARLRCRLVGSPAAVPLV